MRPLSVFVALSVLALIASLASFDAEARKRTRSQNQQQEDETPEGTPRVRLGKGLSKGSSYRGPTLSRQQLATCVSLERSVNQAFAKLDRDEVHISEQEAAVDQYSQSSVDEFNRLVIKYNADGQRGNAQVDKFNQACANRMYYESDMQAVRRDLGL